MPELPAQRRQRLGERFGYTPRDLEQMRSAGVLELVEETLAAGAPGEAARVWWLNELARAAVDAGVEPTVLSITGHDVARVIALVAEGSLTNALARQVVAGVLAGEGDPDAVMAARGLAVVSDDAALGAAVDTAIAGAPDIAAKVREGKVAAAGPLVGAVMKAMRGQADAARVRALLLERLAAG